MRYTTLAVMLLAAGIVTPVSAETPQAAVSTPSFDDCYRLGWVRGVHLERDELPAFVEECMANRIPFDSGNPVSTVRRNPG